MRNCNRDGLCDQTIFILHDLRVDHIIEQLYFYSMNSAIQWLARFVSYLVLLTLPSVVMISLMGWFQTIIVNMSMTAYFTPEPALKGMCCILNNNKKCIAS